MKTDRRVNILWIDDEVTDHTEDAKNLMYARKRLKVKIIHPINLDSELRALKMSNRIPELFLVDYFLDEVKFEGQGNGKYEHRGLSVAGTLREFAPEYPIYVVSQRDTRRKGVFSSEAQAARAVFDKIITFKDLQRDGHDILYYDALDYDAIKTSPRKNLGVLFKLLRTPDGLKERLMQVLPEELREGLAPTTAYKYPNGNAIAFAKWLRQVLLELPGFLYDQLNAATHLGVTVEAFREISAKFRAAKYSGVFAKTSEPLWWASMLNDIIFSIPRSRKVSKTNPWELCPMVFKMPKAMHAKCVVCGDPFPETVGINLKDDSDLKPVHYRCSVPHPNRKRELYFDEPRGFEI